MSENVDNKVDTELSKEDKLLVDLKKKADLLGVTYNIKIGFDKLKAKVDLFLQEDEDEYDCDEGEDADHAHVEQASG